MAFVPEDGTGLANANSLCELAFADAYFADRMVTTWITGPTGARSDPSRQGALIKATDYVEGRWANRFLGDLQFPETQALSFPRLYIEEDGVVPVLVKKAICEYALRSFVGELAPDPVTDASGLLVAATKEKVGPIETEVRYQTGVYLANGSFRPYPAADMLIRPYLSNSGGGVLRA